MSAVIRASDLKRPQALRELLIRRRDEIYVRIRELRHDQEVEAEAVPMDSMEAASTAAEVETHASLIGRAEDELRMLDEALDRVEHGTYGICEDCGEEIPLARLNSVPFAPYCVECEPRHDRAHQRWGDGGTIAPYDQQWALPEEMRAQKEYRVSTNTARPTPAHEEAFPEISPSPVKGARAKSFPRHSK